MSLEEAFEIKERVQRQEQDVSKGKIVIEKLLQEGKDLKILRQLAERPWE